MDDQWFRFKQALVSEIGNELAEQFVSSLFAACQGEIERAKKLYFEIGMAWAPVILHWRNWILKKAKHPPVLIMRDAKPLTVVPISDQWPKIWLNRENCGITDEISKSATKMQPLIKPYLKQNSLIHAFTFVDSGCWGTIVKELHQCLRLRFQPLFFFSHNPSIPGFLNKIGVNEKESEILNDSLECCFPNVVARPLSFIKQGDGKIIPKLKKMDKLSIIFGQAALDGIQTNKIDKNQSPLQDTEVLIELSARAKNGEFTGILPYNSPTWSEGKKFLAAWPKNLQWK